MTGAVNYARHLGSGHYVFLALGERPDPAWVTDQWSWWKQPRGTWVREIGETPEMACGRTAHELEICSSCRATQAGIAARGGAR
jgi:hypothetical protein